MRYFIELSYNGKAYHGWQIQPNAISVQEILEKALSMLLKESISTMGAGRTDAGVHALQMFVHFNTDVIFETKTLIFKLNAFLPEDIAVRAIFKVQPEMHARFDALSRKYMYRVTKDKNPFSIDQALYFKHQMNNIKIKEATKILLEYQDFQCFSKSNTDVKTYNCKIMQAEWLVLENELQFIIKADRFLRNMVRAIVGTLINIGTGKLEVKDLHAIIESKNRSEAGFSVPAHGLYLTEITYPEHLKLKENK